MAEMSYVLKSYNQGMGRMNCTTNMILKQKNEPCMNNTGSSGAYRQYQNDMVNTATPQDLTLMLYNGLIRFLKLAYQGMEENNIEKANNNILRAQDIITEFMSTLDMQYDISHGLYALYDYMNGRLIDANVKKDKAIVEEITGYAEELRDTWAKAMKIAKQQAASAL